MAERQVTVEGVTHLLPAPFMVLATQNPIEHHGTYPLPESQLDRFMLRLRVLGTQVCATRNRFCETVNETIRSTMLCP